MLRQALFLQDDYLPHLPTYEASLIQQRRAICQQNLHAPQLAPFKQAFINAPRIQPSVKAYDQSVITIGQTSDLNEEQHRQLLESLRAFIPWKKGPFDIFGVSIDSEWRSDLKWERLAQFIGELPHARVADIGCHNGYFMFRMAAHSPACVIGFDPVPRFWYNYQFLQSYLRLPNLHFELLGVDDTPLYPRFFDVIYCLGVLYHHQNPIQMLKAIKTSMKKGAKLILDCQGISASEHGNIFLPKNRYATTRGVWFLPDATALRYMLQRSGFRNIELFYSEPLQPSEQRRSSWAPIDSLAEFLDPTDSTKTVEGYPAPWRHYLVAE